MLVMIGVVTGIVVVGGAVAEVTVQTSIFKNLFK